MADPQVFGDCHSNASCGLPSFAQCSDTAKHLLLPGIEDQIIPYNALFDGLECCFHLLRALARFLFIDLQGDVVDRVSRPPCWELPLRFREEGLQKLCCKGAPCH